MSSSGIRDRNFRIICEQISVCILGRAFSHLPKERIHTVIESNHFYWRSKIKFLARGGGGMLSLHKY